MKEISDGNYKVQALTLEDTNARLFGDVAVVTYYQGEERKLHGADPSGSSVWIDVLVNRSGRWLIVAEHGSRLRLTT